MAAAAAGCSASASAPSSVTATAWITAARRTTFCTSSLDAPFFTTSRSWESMHIPQPLIAETASDHSSKSSGAAPWPVRPFMRRRAGMVR